MIIWFLLAYHTFMRSVILFSRLFFYQVEFVMVLIFSMLFILMVYSRRIKRERMIIAIITLIFLAFIVTNTLALATNIWPINIIFLSNIYPIFSVIQLSTILCASTSFRQFRDKQTRILTFIIIL